MTGVPYWNPPERSARLREFTEIVDQMLRNGVTTYRGEYYQVEDADMGPCRSHAYCWLSQPGVRRRCA